MASKKYLCTHCGKRFETEEREIIECPGCFWSTSVKPDSGNAAVQKSPLNSLKPEPSVKRPSLALPAVRFQFNAGKILKPLALAAVLLLVLFLAVSLMRSGIFLKQNRSGEKTEISAPQDRDQVRDALSGGALTAPGAVSSAGLSAEDQAVLSRREALEASAEPSSEMAALLSREASFQSGSVQRLPSKSWTEESFSQMLFEQERAYKVTFPRSYRNKIMDLFRTQYLPGAAAFEAGDLLTARNGWVNALAFPLYSQDPMRHRGVALTMLRPFINDTLSKIGALNTMLVETQLRDQEAEISRDYQALKALISSRSWPEAWQTADRLQKKISGFEQSVTPDSSAPPYPESIRHIDRDIGATLMDILTPPTPPIGNLVPISEDLKTKKAVLETLLPERRQEQAKIYEDGLSRIQTGDFEGAEAALEKVRFPRALAEDAAAKIEVLRKMKNQNLDSAVKTG